ncbi:BREX-1 system adenine-specific DNA-methyltransferase PglX [Companilactobacillus furfuricola]|uniref:BREX-1 system adenine-specific DNA-methyltransferase PglX n=1 Tax=Companilactobacillus furfuricola TaxID=1462575 RepID=UPI000F7B6986|nr:BREX-1 system adenine-specific DNA-methyltransferase PglX [Companilactobacillus furfuricola]
MDKNAIKRFAINARTELLKSVKGQASLIGIIEKGIEEKLPTSTSEIEYYVDDSYPLIGKDIQKRKKLVNELNSRAKKNDYQAAFRDVVEEVAYTWFNRIVAIRFMEVNDYLPSRTRVLSSTQNRNEPDIMFDPLSLEGDLGVFSDEDRQLVNEAWDSEDPIKMDALYKMLFIKQANALNKNLPYLFEKTNDYAELLFTPSYNHGVVKDIVTDISESDFDVSQGGQVEIIGWIYQYYNTELHDEVVNISGGSVKKSDIPAATQLFTTDWVVRYMVDNSLGKYWLERHPESKLKNSLAFLLPENIKPISDPMQVQDIKFVDNAMGSGHVLIYAFDVLMQIYLEEGYSEREAAKQIITKNLYGLEIDNRAYQLAAFSVMMKARQYNRRILKNGDIEPNLHVYIDTNDVSPELLDLIPEQFRTELSELVGLFDNAKELGSIIQIDKTYDYEQLESVVNDVDESGIDLYRIQYSKHVLLQMLELAEVISRKYDVVVTNPPYLNKMDKKLKKYVKNRYADYSGDLFSVFIYNNITWLKPNGYAGFMTPFVWMFIKTYEKLRTYIVQNKEISSLIQMEYSAFEEATVPINTFVIKNSQPENNLGVYIKLSDFKGGMDVQKEKVLEAISDDSCKYLYRTNQANFSKIPGSPIAYWANKNIIKIFSHSKKLIDISPALRGLTTGNNLKFIRNWWEVSFSDIDFGQKRITNNLQKRWYPYNKGGKSRFWYGNNELIVDFQNMGETIKTYGELHNNAYGFQGKGHYFQEGITWTALTSSRNSFRYSPSGRIFDSNKGPMIFPKDTRDILSLLSLFNSKVMDYLTSIINPTISLQNGDMNNIPIVINSNLSINQISKNSIHLSKKDYDDFELSSDFNKHPMIPAIDDDKRSEINGSLKNAFNIWKKEAQDRFDQLKSNEEELNKIFIDLYGLQDELTPEVEDTDVSVRLADEVRDIKSFLSYFVGVVFGRYSLDTEGLAFAGGNWDTSKYKTFVPNDDNILLLNDYKYFDDERDIINRLKEFLSVTFGANNVDENISYIASVVGKKANDDESAIRKYFVDDFFKDHKKVYQKRPIYWEFSSGREDGFKALMYLHRYDEDELAMIRTNYLHPLQGRYESYLNQLHQLLESETVTKEKKRLEKQINHVTKQLAEIKKYDPLIQHLANEKISLNLDDGVVVNYDKLQNGEHILTKYN